jgi:hypothetical protein
MTKARSTWFSILLLAFLVLVIVWFAGPFGKNEETAPATPTGPSTDRATEESAVQVSPADTPMRNPLADPAESARN